MMAKQRRPDEDLQQDRFCAPFIQAVAVVVDVIVNVWMERLME